VPSVLEFAPEAPLRYRRKPGPVSAGPWSVRHAVRRDKAWGSSARFTGTSVGRASRRCLSWYHFCAPTRSIQACRSSGYRAEGEPLLRAEGWGPPAAQPTSSATAPGSIPRAHLMASEGGDQLVGVERLARTVHARALPRPRPRRQRGSSSTPAPDAQPSATRPRSRAGRDQTAHLADEHRGRAPHRPQTRDAQASRPWATRAHARSG
jgi:hypothetical protein